ncbi:MAG: hypothetical protein WDO24_15300 [Pseudomonadota bacterium]
MQLEERHRRAADIDLEHRQIGLVVRAHQFGLELAAVGEHDPDLVGILDHMVVGHDQPVGPDDHARAERVLDLVAAERRQVAEEPGERTGR